MIQLDYEEIVTHLKSDLNTDCAIANRYGIVLGSKIQEFAKGNVIPQSILDLIIKRKELANELNLNQINSFALEAQEVNYLFTLSEELILISRLNLNVNLAEFMPSIRAFTQKLSKRHKEQKGIREFSKFDFSNEISNIKSTLNQKHIGKNKYSIIKELIKFIST